MICVEELHPHVVDLVLMDGLPDCELLGLFCSRVKLDQLFSQCLRKSGLCHPIAEFYLILTVLSLSLLWIKEQEFDRLSLF